LLKHSIFYTLHQKIFLTSFLKCGQKEKKPQADDTEEAEIVTMTEGKMPAITEKESHV